MMDSCFLFDICNHRDCDKDFCIRKYKTNALFDAALLSDKQRNKLTLYLDNDQADLEAYSKLANLSQNISDFVNSGKNLYIHSIQCGNGKTSWAIRFIQNYLKVIWYKSDSFCKALFVSVPVFLNALKESISSKNDYAEYIKQHVLEADLVVWDDIATKAGTEYEINQLLSFIDQRINLGKSNIYTSNLENKDKMFVALGERLTSRIYNYSIDIELHGADKRNLIIK